jgi:hypothetical protein
VNTDEAHKFIGTCVLIDPKNHGRDAAWHRGMLIGIDKNDGIVKPKGHKHAIHVELKYLKPWKKGISMNNPEKAEHLFAKNNHKHEEKESSYILKYLSDNGNYFRDKKFIEVPQYKLDSGHFKLREFKLTQYSLTNALRASKKMLSSSKRNLENIEIVHADSGITFMIINKNHKEIAIQETDIVQETTSDPTTQITQPATQSEIQSVTAAQPTIHTQPVSTQDLSFELSELYNLYKIQRESVFLANEMMKNEEIKLLKLELEIDKHLMKKKLGI